MHLVHAPDDFFFCTASARAIYWNWILDGVLGVLACPWVCGSQFGTNLPENGDELMLDIGNIYLHFPLNVHQKSGRVIRRCHTTSPLNGDIILCQFPTYMYMFIYRHIIYAQIEWSLERACAFWWNMGSCKTIYIYKTYLLQSLCLLLKYSWTFW